MNTITVNGRLGKDPELKEYQPGKFLCNFSLAENWYDFKTKKQETTWFRVTAFGALAQRVDKAIHKGDNVVVVGEVRLNEYTVDGTTTVQMQINMNNFDLIGTGHKKEEVGASEEAEMPYNQTEPKTDDGLPF